jgi:hypothetical protein
MGMFVRTICRLGVDGPPGVEEIRWTPVRGRPLRGA